MNWKSPWIFVIGLFAVMLEFFEYVTYGKSYLFGPFIGAILLSKNFSENKLPKVAMILRIVAILIGVMIPIILIFSL
ncbi:MAG: hypothetical protein PHW96_02910 [Candidatus Nanoarchaeia archaeon]|nr:hypothetical protein [Candidatus Nanoarchaeia archaeon]